MVAVVVRHDVCWIEEEGSEGRGVVGRGELGEVTERVRGSLPKKSQVWWTILIFCVCDSGSLCDAAIVLKMYLVPGSRLKPTFFFVF